MKFESGSLGFKSLLKTSLVAHPWVDYFTFWASASTPTESMSTTMEQSREGDMPAPCGCPYVPASGWAARFLLVPSHQPRFDFCLCLLVFPPLLLPLHIMRKREGSDLSLWKVAEAFSYFSEVGSYKIYIQQYQQIFSINISFLISALSEF